MLVRRLGSFCAVVLIWSAAAVCRAGEINGRVTDAQGNGIAEAVVFVQDMPGVAVQRAGSPRAVMDQVHKQFVPHVLPVVVGTEVSFPNHDQIHHHVYSFSRTRTFEIPLYKGEEAPPVLFDKVDPLNPINRRISIIVMNKKAEEAARNDGGTVDVDAENPNPEQPIMNGVQALPPAPPPAPTR